VAEVNAAPTRRWSAADVEALGIDPVAARRHFQKRFGMSFLAYSRAHRVADAFASIKAGASVLSAQLDAGFESSSAFRDAFAKGFGLPPIQEQSSVLLRSAWIDTPLGTMIALTDASRLHMLEFSNRKHLNAIGAVPQPLERGIRPWRNVRVTYASARAGALLHRPAARILCRAGEGRNTVPGAGLVAPAPHPARHHAFICEAGGGDRLAI
jgi:AraC-like DNA-binding protein